MKNQSYRNSGILRSILRSLQFNTCSNKIGGTTYVRCINRTYVTSGFSKPGLETNVILSVLTTPVSCASKKYPYTIKYHTKFNDWNILISICGTLAREKRNMYYVSILNQPLRERSTICTQTISSISSTH